ncbi:hypothetical protein PV04_08579 [Phialophora macrospora]|uniref:Uncharacterized protein n=1 Tax=Phialophora macrospora TaxID=1851006 RepID=A0A0D2CER5_9EURO|nr:hypothetical protein PV04_08579 [Phialophora macrospora]
MRYHRQTPSCSRPCWRLAGLLCTISRSSSSSLRVSSSPSHRSSNSSSMASRRSSSTCNPVRCTRLCSATTSDPPCWSIGSSSSGIRSRRCFHDSIISLRWRVSSARAPLSFSRCWNRRASTRRYSRIRMYRTRPIKSHIAVLLNAMRSSRSVAWSIVVAFAARMGTPRTVGMVGNLVGFDWTRGWR